jgi:hypothetical protein
VVLSGPVGAQLTAPRGTIELINTSKWSINVRDIETGACPLYYFTPTSKLSKDGKACKVADLRVGDIVLMTWALDPYSTMKKNIRTLVCLPTLIPAKLKVGQVGYLSLPGKHVDTMNQRPATQSITESQERRYVCVAVDKDKVLIRELIIVRTYERITPPASPTSRKTKSPAAVEDKLVGTKHMEGAAFFLTGVNPSDYAPGREATLDGKWRVETTTSATVTKSSAIYSTILSTQREGQSEEEARVKTATESDKQTGNAVTNSKQKTDTKVRARAAVADQAKVASSAQDMVTVRISGFVLVPVLETSP